MISYYFDRLLSDYSPGRNIVFSMCQVAIFIVYTARCIAHAPCPFAHMNSDPCCDPDIKLGRKITSHQRPCAFALVGRLGWIDVRGSLLIAKMSSTQKTVSKRAISAWPSDITDAFHFVYDENDRATKAHCIICKENCDSIKARSYRPQIAWFSVFY